MAAPALGKLVFLFLFLFFIVFPLLNGAAEDDLPIRALPIAKQIVKTRGGLGWWWCGGSASGASGCSIGGGDYGRRRHQAHAQRLPEAREAR